MVLLALPICAALVGTDSTASRTYDQLVDSYDRVGNVSILHATLSRGDAGINRGPTTARPPEPAGVNSGFGVAAEGAKVADSVVLGHYPEYVDLAKATDGRTFQVPKNVWNSMSPAEQWAANQKFLDRSIARGGNVQLATPANAAREGSFFERELQYMQSRGYTVSSDGMRLIAPGGP